MSYVRFEESKVSGISHEHDGIHSSAHVDEKPLQEYVRAETGEVKWSEVGNGQCRVLKSVAAEYDQHRQRPWSRHAVPDMSTQTHTHMTFHP